MEWSAYNFSYNDATSNSFLNATDDGSLSGPTFTKSEITSSGRQGNDFNFLWMNLDKSAVNISYMHLHQNQIQEAIIIILLIMRMDLMELLTMQLQVTIYLKIK